MLWLQNAKKGCRLSYPSSLIARFQWNYSTECSKENIKCLNDSLQTNRKPSLQPPRVSIGQLLKCMSLIQIIHNDEHWLWHCWINQSLHFDRSVAPHVRPSSTTQCQCAFATLSSMYFLMHMCASYPPHPWNGLWWLAIACTSLPHADQEACIAIYDTIPCKTRLTDRLKLTCAGHIDMTSARRYDMSIVETFSAYQTWNC